MARPLRIEFPGAYYHVMNRGNDRQKIFDTDEDYKLFVRKLGDFSNSYRVGVLSYCLMAKQLLSWLEFDRLVNIVSAYYETKPEDLLSRYFRDGDARCVLMYLSSKHCRGRYSLTELSEFHGISLGGYTSSCHKFNQRLSGRTDLKKAVKQIEGRLTI